MKPTKEKPVKISKKIPARELREMLRKSLETLVDQNALVGHLEELAVHEKNRADEMSGEFERGHASALAWIRREAGITDAQMIMHDNNTAFAVCEMIKYERNQKERAQEDFEKMRIGYLDKTERLDEAYHMIQTIIAELHNSAVITRAGLTADETSQIGDGLGLIVAAEIISRVNQIAADFSRARDEQLAVAAREHHEEILSVEKRLETAYEDMRAKYEAEVELNKMSERQLQQAESSARNAWRAVELAKRSWWRKALEWANRSRDLSVPLGVNSKTGDVIYYTSKGAGK